MRESVDVDVVADVVPELDKSEAVEWEIVDLVLEADAEVGDLNPDLPSSLASSRRLAESMCLDMAGGVLLDFPDPSDDEEDEECADEPTLISFLVLSDDFPLGGSGSAPI